MVKISYNANGLRTLSVIQAIGEVAEAGYQGIELSLHPAHLDPFTSTKKDLDAIAETLAQTGIEAPCLATGADNLLSEERFEPSLIHAERDDRQKRIDLIKRAIDMAHYLKVPVLNFASGILKQPVEPPAAHDYLVEGIQACLDHAGTDLVLAIEPEPGFFIETNETAAALIQELGSRQFRLNQDLGHTNVCVDDYLKSTREAMALTVHFHVEDIKKRVHYHEIPGEGEIDFPAVAEVLRDTQYPYFISVELYNHADVYREALRKSLDFLNSVIDGNEGAHP